MNFVKKADHFIFYSQPRYLIDFIRIAFYSYLFIFSFENNEIAGYLKLSSEYWNPSGLFIWLPFLRPPLEISPLIHILWQLTLLFCVVGFLTPFVKWLSLILTLLFFGYFSNFYIYTANYIILTYCVIVFTFCDIGKCWSLDNFLSKKKCFNTNEFIPAWTLRLIQIMDCLPHFFCEL
jgi:hypothetical protein